MTNPDYNGWKETTKRAPELVALIALVASFLYYVQGRDEQAETLIQRALEAIEENTEASARMSEVVRHNSAVLRKVEDVLERHANNQ